MRTILDTKMTTALNGQVNAELWSAYLYLSMAYDMKDKGFDGFAHWFELQAEEEFEHAQRFMDYIVARDAKVKLLPVGEVRQEWNTPKDAFEDTLMHEKVVTEKIHMLNDMAVELKDYATQSMLKWFIDEQVEEENTARGILQAFEKVSGDAAALWMLNKESGKRKED